MIAITAAHGVKASAFGFEDLVPTVLIPMSTHVLKSSGVDSRGWRAVLLVAVRDGRDESRIVVKSPVRVARCARHGTNRAVADRRAFAVDE